MYKIKLWWLNGKSNFGDILTPYIFEYFNIPYEFIEDRNKADAICVGSIARRASTGCMVLGSGIVKEFEKLNPNADYKFVRGPLTRKRVLDSGGSCPEIYGDPAMLLPLFCDESKKEYEVSIIPHYVDYDLVKEKYGKKFNIIKILNHNPLEVAQEITKSKRIISSSLHGIICAHAYNIPAAWVKFSDNIRGDGTKFKDHYSALNIECVQSTVEDPIFSTGSLDLDPIIQVFKTLKNE